MSIGWNQPTHASDTFQPSHKGHSERQDDQRQAYSNRSSQNWNGFEFVDEKESMKQNEERVGVLDGEYYGPRSHQGRMADNLLQRRATAIVTKLICLGRRISQRSVHMKNHGSTSSLVQPHDQPGQSRTRFCEILVEGYGNGLNKVVIERTSHLAQLPYEYSTEVLPEVVAISTPSVPRPITKPPQHVHPWTLRGSHGPSMRPKTATGLVHRQERHDISGFQPQSSVVRSRQLHVRPKTADQTPTLPEYNFDPRLEWDLRHIQSRPESASGRTPYPFTPDMILPSNSLVRADWMFPHPALSPARPAVKSIQTLNDLSSQDRKRPSSSCKLRRSNATLERGDSWRTMTLSPVSPISPISPVLSFAPSFQERNYNVHSHSQQRRSTPAPHVPPRSASKRSSSAYQTMLKNKQLPTLPSEDEEEGASEVRRPKKRFSLPASSTATRSGTRPNRNGSIQKRRKSVTFAPGEDVQWS